MRALMVALGFAFACHAAEAGARQETVAFQVDGQKVVGTLEVPDGAVAPPVILLLHGFGGTRDELIIPSLQQGIFARAADAWAAQGLGSLRIDFRGGGDSEGAFEDTTISGQVKDALAAVEYLQTQKTVDGSLKIYPIKGFGALEEGEHRFCDSKSGQCEGIAKFVMIWRHKRAQWQVTRVMSYGHRALPAGSAP